MTITAWTGRAAAEAPFSFATTPGKLPKTVVPVHYAIDLKPDLDKLTFAGSETVDIEVLEPTDRLVLNAVDLAVSDGHRSTAKRPRPTRSRSMRRPRP